MFYDGPGLLHSVLLIQKKRHVNNACIFPSSKIKNVYTLIFFVISGFYHHGFRKHKEMVQNTHNKYIF